MLDGPVSRAGGAAGLSVAWSGARTIINLRGRPDDEAFLQACQAELGLALPTQPCRTVERDGRRILWAGPDEWFVLGSTGQDEAWVQALRTALTGLHAAVTDVSSGYHVLQLGGDPVRDVLARGCPLDLHPRAFDRDSCQGTHFFKAAIWLWQPSPLPAFELLLRRSFKRYVGVMLDRATVECGTCSA